MIEWVWFFAKLFLIGLACLTFFYSISSHLMLWQSLRLKQLYDEPNVIIPWKHLFKNIVIEAACAFSCFILSPFANKISLAPKNNSQAKTPPILLIHGFLHTQNDWLWFRHQLEKNTEIGPIFTINLLPNEASIAQHAKILEQKIEEIKILTKQDKIILIGHSRGGLVASFYAERLNQSTGSQNSVQAIIAIATPFSGTPVSVYGYLSCVKELAPNAPLLTAMKEDLQASTIPYYFVASKLDNMILPWQSACPLITAKAENTLILENEGHLSLLLSRSVVTKTLEWVLNLKIN